ncbi:hypothetical protein COCC4DRAFT_193557 [Bipolaris maydis ATCC 48331]|uniref:Uncharacterized protein n=2 Tax=Cochliobolus heterostrophus TaxID=5016 RepID=M2TXB1_COCH5|nr:uncharacterized protein COCC4DRAFT_193557 [Bipolaris maydis ATCC 48331]EMD86331.1 hypothetical protein COCHEDRAFT_1160634 [Bipolaris maydis C5]KAH7551761.1 hypothetical protein BM1_09395 [Bipolaris maydis]ENI06278.1 hypothetical protein COCC4DRAFT_193557 [Bipolaris maydis ATCC 48331]KAJ6213955.1 hypothetical protein PSV09DRAFT_1160634 [Bipolaris maydis]KAJ6275157.1 hypothetical protein PSV08DRAFT_384934 [Bipolaris maydis]
MLFAIQPHTSHSQRSFSESRFDSQIRERWDLRTKKPRESTDILSTKRSFRVEEESLPPDVVSEDQPLPMPLLEMKIALKVSFDKCRSLLEDFDREFRRPRRRIIMSSLGIYWDPLDPSYHVRCSPSFSDGQKFTVLFSYSISDLKCCYDYGTIADPVECTIWKKSEEANPESYERQQQELQEKRLCYKPRHRNKVQKEPSGFTNVLTRHDTILEIVDNLEQNPLSSLQIETKVEWRTAHGRSSLKNWRRGAGKSKSWKLCSKSTVPKQTRLNASRRSSKGVVYRSAQPPLWLPAAFIRSQTAKKSSWPGYMLRRQDIDSVPRRVRCHDPYTHDFEDTPISQHGKHHTKAAQKVKTWESESEIAEDMNGEPAGAFIRFTWKDKILTNRTRQLDRFLSASSILHSYWHVTGFLRNESFADVYSLSKPPFTPSSAEPEASLEAHVFLDEYHGNCAVYASRSKNRMRQSGNCLDTFWHNGRHVFIMKIPKKPTLFKLRNSEEDFPVLVDKNKCNEQVALQRRRFRGRPSFAAMAGGGWPNANSEFRPVQMDERKSPLEKELERIEKARMKKAERQRVKRKLQREERLMKKECRSAIATAFMVVHE